MAGDSKVDLVVLGGGPGGYAAAFAAADRASCASAPEMTDTNGGRASRAVVLVDDAAVLGGVCLHRGCIPSKALLHVAHVIRETRHAADWGITFAEPTINLDRLREWKTEVVSKLSDGVRGLCTARGVEHISARGRFLDSRTLELTAGDGSVRSLEFGHAIIATGSSPVMPALFDMGDPRVMDSTAALELPDIPARLLVIGGGYIGLELGCAYSAFGSQVTVVEMTAGLLPGVDRDLIGPLKRRLEDQFAAIHLKTTVTGLSTKPEGIVAEWENEAGRTAETFDRVLVAVGRRPNSGDLGLENTVIRVDGRGFVVVDGQRRTAEERILAIGDVAGEPMLAHKAAREAHLAVAVLNGESASFENVVVPAVVFTDPEIAWCGLTEQTAKAAGRRVKAVRFPWAASGRARTLGRTDGITKLIVDPEGGRLLGVGIVGPGAAELIAEGVLAIQTGMTARELAECIHPHPTLSETIMEAAESSIGQATHLFRRRR